MFSLRIDIDTYKGLRAGIPNLLDAFARYEVPASIYSVMGWEGDILSTLKYRILRAKRVTFSNKEIPGKKSSAAYMNYVKSVRPLLFPVPFTTQKKVFARMGSEGHEVGTHGYIHVVWNGLKRLEMEREFARKVAAYQKMYGLKPTGMCTPLGVHNKDVEDCAQQFGFTSVSYLGSDATKMYSPEGKDFVLVPSTLHKGERCVPLIEYYLTQGLSADKVVAHTCAAIDASVAKTGFAPMYIHPKIEGFVGLSCLRRVLAYVVDSGYDVLTTKDVAKKGI